MINSQFQKKISLNKRYQLFSEQIVQWYLDHGRHDLPWRKKVTPYRIWISEIMLQQTQVKTALGYYKRFIKKWPTIEKLANADLEEVLVMWSGLGYYSRAKNLLKTAKIVLSKHKKKI